MFSLCPAHLWVLVMLTVTASFHFCSLRITKTLKESFPGSCPPKNQLLKGRCGFETLTRHLSASLNTYTRIKKLTTTARVCSSVWKKLEMCFNNAIRSHHIWGYGQAQPARARSLPCCWWLNLTGPVCSWQGEHRCFLSMSPMFYAATIQLFTGVPDIPVHYVWFFFVCTLKFQEYPTKSGPVYAPAAARSRLSPSLWVLQVTSGADCGLEKRLPAPTGQLPLHTRLRVEVKHI